MFQLIVMLQGIEKVTIQLIDTPTKVYAIGARLFLSKVPLDVLQNWVLIQLVVTPHNLEKIQGQLIEVCRLIGPCLLIGTREYLLPDCGFATPEECFSLPIVAIPYGHSLASDLLFPPALKKPCLSPGGNPIKNVYKR